MTAEINIFGWERDEAGAKVYARSLDDDAAFWDSLRAADDGADRFSYRALVLCLAACEPWVRNAWISIQNAIAVLGTYNQGNIGACVGTGEAMRASVMAALDIYLRLEAEEFRSMFSPEAAYALSREESGMLGRSDGSTGFGAAKANVKWGALPQGSYPGNDLRKYSVSTCASLGRKGLPKELKSLAVQHKSAQYAKVDTAEKAWLIAGIVPFNLCSDIGWAKIDQIKSDAKGNIVVRVNQDRDADGALKRRDLWSHSMCAGSARRTTAKGRRLILVHQSWGADWCGGSYYLDQPLGSFYADVDDVGAAAAQDDTFADLGYLGFQRTVPPDIDFMRM